MEYRKIGMWGVGGLMTLIALSTHAFGNYHSEYAYDSCDSCLCSGYYVLYENVIVRPHFSRNNAYFLDDPGGVAGQKAVMFDWDYKYSPRIELGWVNECGVGLRARYWRFNNETTLSASSADGNIEAWFADDSISPEIGFGGTENAVFHHKLELDVVDVEFSVKHCNWIYSAGGRYTCMSQQYKAEDLDDTEAIKAKYSFDGGGLTTALGYYQPIWCGLSLFTKARGSLLYGCSSFKVFNPLNPGSELSGPNDRDLLAVGELQLGVDWTGSFCDICTFIRFAVETQYWIGGGAGGPGCNAVYDEGNYQSSNPQDSNLGFFGFNIALGVMF